MKPGQPANYLLIGSDVRPANETPQEAQSYGTSATTGGAALRRDDGVARRPAGHTGMLVSFPRDLMVKIPGHGRQQLNAAYDIGGPALVIETLEANFQPLEINHYLEVDFRGLPAIVNAIGHIHLWFPTPGARSRDGAQHGHGGHASASTATGARVRAVARLLHAQEPAEPGAVAVGLRPNSGTNEVRGGTAGSRRARRPRPHPAPAVLPAHVQPGRDRQDGRRTPSRSSVCSTRCSRTSHTTRRSSTTS